MEGNRKAPVRALQRAFECNRLEEQLWATAYEQVWPLLHRSLKRSDRQPQPCHVGQAKNYVARRA
jgi:hypothetical protein